MKFHSKIGMTYNTTARHIAHCVAFWKIYFDEIAQRPSDNVRLRPSNLHTTHLYDLEFLPFMKRVAPEEKIPGKTVFQKALRHPEFADISKQTKHTHVRCTDCAMLSAEKTRAFRTGEDTTDVMSKVRAHSDHVRAWRESETYYKMLAEHSPHVCNTYMADDTSVVGFPHFTNRPVKATATKRRPEFIPWLVKDHARGEEPASNSLLLYKSMNAPLLCTHSLTHSLTHWHSLALTHSLTHSFTVLTTLCFTSG